MRGILAPVFVAVLTISTAHADFSLTTVREMPPAQTANILPDSVERQGTSPATTGGGDNERAAKLPSAKFFTAQGFGNQVPLAFAVRQIVPKAVTVLYGSGADKTVPVSWRGGQPWNRVLTDAVRPVGLRLVMTTMTVEIRR